MERNKTGRGASPVKAGLVKEQVSEPRAERGWNEPVTLRLRHFWPWNRQEPEWD